MTVKELEERRDDAVRAYESLDGCSQHTKNLMGILGDLKKAEDKAAREKLYVDATTELGYVMQAISGTKMKLWDYKALLDDIMRNTEIAWPPKCAAGKAAS